jgi:hypothetical protein
MTGYEMRDKARLASEEAKSNNTSGFLQSMGDIGYQEKNMQLIDYALGKGLFGNGAEVGYAFTRGKYKDKSNSKSKVTTVTKAMGGALKRKRKGLTF